MTDSTPNSRCGSGPGGIGIPAEFRPHAYDPATNPELFEGVLARRIVAFATDVIVIAIPLAIAAVFIFVIGLITLGLGWALFWLLSPASVVWALFYYGMSTLGMRTMGIEIRTWYGAPAYFVLGAVHAIVYWISVSVLSPFVLLVGFFNARRRLLHDMIVGTVVINSAARAASLQPRMVRHG